MLVILKVGAPLKRVLPDGTKEWYDEEDKVFSVYRKEFEFRGTAKAFASVAWTRYFASKDDFYESPSLEAQDRLLNRWQSPAASVGDQVSPNVANIGEKAYAGAVLEDDDDWDFEGVVRLDEVERVGVER